MTSPTDATASTTTAANSPPLQRRAVSGHEDSLSSQQLNILTLIEFGNLVTGIPSADVGGVSLVVPGALDIMAVLGEKITDPDTVSEWLTISTIFLVNNESC